MSTPDESTLREARPIDGPDLFQERVTLEGLGLTKLSPTEWRVTDAHRDESDPAAVLGFIQNVGGAFEVTNLVRLRERSYFSTFDRAAASLRPQRRIPTPTTSRKVHA